eukprot:1161009-Pelagomonas_calceolata.AAC.11
MEVLCVCVYVCAVHAPKCKQTSSLPIAAYAQLLVPLVKLDDAHFKLVDAMEKHIPPGSEPSLIGARSLIVKGPVKFSK